MSRVRIAALTAAAVACAACRPRDMLIDLPATPRAAASATSAEPAMPALPDDVLTNAEEQLIDRALSPCESFYDFACGGVVQRHVKAPPPVTEMSDAARLALAKGLLDPSAKTATAGGRAAGIFFQACVAEAKAPAEGRTRLFKREVAVATALKPSDAKNVLRVAASFEKRGVHVFFDAAPASWPNPNGRVTLEVVPHVVGPKVTAADVARAVRAVGIDDDNARTMSAAVERVQRALAAGAPQRDVVYFDAKTPDARIASYAGALAELGIKEDAPLSTRYAEWFLALPGRIAALATADLHAYFSFRIAEEIADWTPTADDAGWIDNCALRTVALFEPALRSEVAARVGVPDADARIGVWFTRTRDALIAAGDRGELVATHRSAWLEALPRVTSAIVAKPHAMFDGMPARPLLLLQVSRANMLIHAESARIAGAPFVEHTPPLAPFALVPLGDRANTRVVFPPASLSVASLAASAPLPVALGTLGPMIGEAILVAARPGVSASNAMPASSGLQSNGCDPAEARAAAHAAVLRALLHAAPQWQSSDATSDLLLLRRRAYLAFAQNQCSAAPETARLYVNRTLSTIPSFQVDYACKGVPTAPATCSAL